MCGIVAYAGENSAAPILISGLKRLSYRGYDSAGIAVLREGKIHLVKREGSVSKLEEAALPGGTTGIGHTRWATHGAPTEANAHPHVFGRFAVVHNGIIENMNELKAHCLARGEIFSSETDSEVIAHLLEEFYEGDVLAAMKKTASLLVGAFAVAALCTEEEDTVVLARRASPLLAGRKGSALYAASDIPAIAEEGMEIYALNDGEFALMRKNSLRFFNDRGEIFKRPAVCAAEESAPEKEGYRHFMRKEMAEIPRAMEKTLLKFRQTPCLSAFREVLCHTEYIEIVACGTAYHSGLCARVAIEALARVRVGVTFASEFRYRDPILSEGTLVVAISQSGETADTLAAARLAQERGAKVAALTNVKTSSLARLADFVFYTEAGPEIAVAATKSFNAQLVALYALAQEIASAKGRACFLPLDDLPALAKKTWEAAETVRSWTAHFIGARSVFFLGRGADYCAALEGSLKLKEISYLPSEGYPAGELKHGTLALVEQGTPVVAVLTSEKLAEKTMNAVHETLARGAKVFLITSLPAYAERHASVLIPDAGELLSPALSAIPLQALAYYVSLARGNDPDKPRNLAKSVTVE